MNIALVKSSFLIWLFLLTGCDEQKYINENLADRWVDALRQYQIHPTFTSREDIQVGDLILTCERDDKEADTKRPTIPISMLLARLDVKTALETFYKSSINLPSVARINSESELVAGNVVLKNAAFPDFLTAQISGTDIGAALPSGKVMAGFGISTKDIQSVSVSVPAVGTYQLPVYDLLESLKLEPNKTAIAKLQSNEILSSYITDYVNESCVGDIPLILLVSEIYAAYGLKVDINLSTAAAANIKAAINVSDSKSKLDLINAFGNIFGIPPQKVTSTKADGSTDQGAKVVDGSGNAPKSLEAATAATTEGAKTTSRMDDFKNYLDLVNAKSESNSSTGYPGVKFSTYSGSFAGISIERQFDRPVVIGVKGISFKLNDVPKTNSPAAPSTKRLDFDKPKPPIKLNPLKRDNRV